MSVCHILFKQVSDDHGFSKYEVITGDLSDTFTEEVVGEIVVDKQQKDFKFTPMNSWIEKKAFPPELFTLKDEDKKILVEEKYQGYCCALWSRGVCRAITKRIRENDFPKKFAHIS